MECQASINTITTTREASQQCVTHTSHHTQTRINLALVAAGKHLMNGETSNVRFKQMLRQAQQQQKAAQSLKHAEMIEQKNTKTHSGALCVHNTLKLKQWKVSMAVIQG